MESLAQNIQIENAPHIPGLTFRAFRGAADYPHMAAIINAANRADGLDEIITTEILESNYQHLQRSDTDQDLLFVEIDGEPVGYGRCMWDQEQNGDYLYSFFLHMKPKGRLAGLGEAVTAHFMQHLKEIAEKHPARAPKYYQSWSSKTQKWYRGLLEGHNLNPVRYSILMSRPCNQPVKITPLPEGIEVRPVTAENFRKVWDAHIEAFRDHWGFVEPTEKDYHSWLDSPHLNPRIWKVAWDGDEVAGMVLNYINHDENETFNRKRGYTEYIGVRRPWRRQGIARALLTRSILMFQQMGMEETALSVDTENPSGALGLYQKIGYKEYRRNMRYRKEMVTKEKDMRWN